jgi:hypothetical protein
MGSDNWDGFGYCVLGIGFAMFLPFVVSLFGRDARWQAISLGFCIATPLLLLNSHDVLMLLSWLAAWVFAGVAIWARIKVKLG